MKHQKEFPDFVLDVEIPAGFHDTSWHNDASPSWMNQAENLQLFIDYPKVEDREIQSGGRFTLAYLDEHGSITNDFTTDDWAEMLAHVEKAVAL